MSRVIDVFHYNGETEILKLHLNILAPYVDKFIICEAKTTFSGNKKPLYFFRDQRYFKQFWPKIHYYVIDEEYTEEEINLAQNSPNTAGAAHWQREFLQKESIKKALIKSKVQDEDLVVIGDCDEIVDLSKPIEAHGPIPLLPIKLKLWVYAYYLNNLSSEEFWGPIIAQYRDIKSGCLNHYRSTNHYKTDKYYGIHFTSMGGLKEVSRKLNDSYTTESYNTYEIQEKLPQRLKEGKDYLGRDFTFQIDESQWPDYLKNNRSQFKNLLWPAN